MLKARNFRAGHWLYSANCYEQSELCRADSVGSKPLVANSCDCLREQARAQKGYRPSAICSARYLPRPSAPPSPIAPSKILACPIEKYGHPQKVNVQVPRLLFRPSFLSHPPGWERGWRRVCSPSLVVVWLGLWGPGGRLPAAASAAKCRHEASQHRRK
jgi:hypothetical protein